MKQLLQLTLALLLSAHCNSQQLDSILHLPAPGKASLFAPGIISNGLNNRDFTISPDGTEIFYTIQSARFLKSAIIYLQHKKGKWTAPQVAPFSGRYRDLEAFFAPDGNAVYFSSDRPVNDKDSLNDFDIWKVARTASGWSSPTNLGAPVNSPKNEFYPSVSRNNSIYFTAEPLGGFGEEDIVRCAVAHDHYLEREILDTAINTKGDEFNAFIDPAENFIIFSSYKGRSDEQGGGDLYISYSQTGKWTTAVNIVAANTPSLDYCPFVSADKKTLFFASNRNTIAGKTAKNYTEFINMLQGAGNTTDDIYWVDFSKLMK